MTVPRKIILKFSSSDLKFMDADVLLSTHVAVYSLSYLTAIFIPLHFKMK